MVERKESLINLAFRDGDIEYETSIIQSQTLENLAPHNGSKPETRRCRVMHDEVEKIVSKHELINPNKSNQRGAEQVVPDLARTTSSASKLASSILAKDLKAIDALLSDIGNLPETLDMVEKRLSLSGSHYDAALLCFIQARSALSTAQLDNDMTGFQLLEKAFWASCFDYPEMHELVAEAYISSLLQGRTMPFQLLHDEALQTVHFESASSGSCKQNMIIPTSNELVPPKSRKWPDVRILGRTRRAIYAYEQKVWQGVKTGALSQKQASFAYHNLTKLCESPAELVTCFIISAMWALQAIEKQHDQHDTHNKLHMAYVVVHCVEQAIICCNEELLVPALKYHVNRIAYALTKRTNECTGLASAANCALDCLKAVGFFAPFSPLSQPPVVAVCEAQKFFEAYTQVYVSYIKQIKTELSPKERPISSAKLNYFLFELAVTCETSGLSVLERHAEAIDSVLDAYDLSNDEFTSFIEAGYTSQNNWPAECTAALPHGQLITESECFADVSGFCLDEETDELSILGTIACAADDALITLEDVFVAILASKESELPSFSLENPEPLFQLNAVLQCNYGPPVLAGSGVLNTMFFADYLLKQFFMGSEVSAVEPFEIRPAQALYQGLPTETVNKLKSLSQRGVSRYRARLWIQDDAVDYDVQQQGSKTTYVVDDPRIIVKLKPTFVGADGATHDEDKPPDTHDVDAWREQNQVLQSFCDDFTECYDELCKKYRQLRRLQKLAKLHEACRLLQRQAQDDAALRRAFDNIYAAAKKSREDVKQADKEIVPAVLVCSRHARGYVYGGVSLGATTLTQKPLKSTGQRISLTARIDEVGKSVTAFVLAKNKGMQAASQVNDNAAECTPIAGNGHAAGVSNDHGDGMAPVSEEDKVTLRPFLPIARRLVDIVRKVGSVVVSGVSVPVCECERLFDGDEPSDSQAWKTLSRIFDQQHKFKPEKELKCRGWRKEYAHVRYQNNRVLTFDLKFDVVGYDSPLLVSVQQQDGRIRVVNAWIKKSSTSNRIEY